MKLTIEIVFIMITVFFFFGSMGEKDYTWKTNYFLGTIVMAVLVLLANKFL